MDYKDYHDCGIKNAAADDQTHPFEVGGEGIPHALVSPIQLVRIDGVPRADSDTIE
jgi:hypothetical protein